MRDSHADGVAPAHPQLPEPCAEASGREDREAQLQLLRRTTDTQAQNMGSVKQIQARGEIGVFDMDEGMDEIQSLADLPRNATDFVESSRANQSF
jgi:hypothetical protein